jgi:hypothetical protein
MDDPIHAMSSEPEPCRILSFATAAPLSCERRSIVFLITGVAGLP